MATNLNLARPDTTETPVRGERREVIPPKLLLMLDIESLDLGPRPIITQVALFGLDLEEDEILDRHHYQYYPVKPQMELKTPRTFSFDTVLWWTKQGDDARSRLAMSSSTEFEELPSLLRHLITTFNNLTNNGTIPYELMARGPQFDVVAVESLLLDCGLAAPWKYDKVRDLRTLMALAGLDASAVVEPKGFVKHTANWDVKFQIECYRESMRQLRSR